jgi:hypothetical protein
LLNHTFVVGKWSDLGVAQWAGGFITYALEKVRTTNQIIRDGMVQLLNKFLIMIVIIIQISGDMGETIITQILLNILLGPLSRDFLMLLSTQLMMLDYY